MDAIRLRPRGWVGVFDAVRKHETVERSRRHLVEVDVWIPVFFSNQLEDPLARFEDMYPKL